MEEVVGAERKEEDVESPEAFLAGKHKHCDAVQGHADGTNHAGEGICEFQEKT
jgi:hypothetical protein